MRVITRAGISGPERSPDQVSPSSRLRKIPPRFVPAQTWPGAAAGISIAVIAVPSSSGETGRQPRPSCGSAPQAARSHPERARMRRVDRQHGDRVLMMLVLLHALRTDFFPEILAPVLGRGVPEDVYIGARAIYVVLVLGVEHHPRAVAAQHVQKLSLPAIHAGQQGSVVLRAAAENPPVCGRHVDVVEHRIHQPANAKFPAFTKIVTHHDAAIVSRANPIASRQNDRVLIGVHILRIARGCIPAAGAPPPAAAVAADVYVVQPADHDIGIVRMHRDRAVIGALAFSCEMRPAHFLPAFSAVAAAVHAQHFIAQPVGDQRVNRIGA